MRLDRAGIFALLLLLGLGAQAGTFEKLQKDPLYQEVQRQCVPGDPYRSFFYLQREFLEDTSRGAQTGLLAGLSAGLLANPLVIDDAVENQWDSSPFYLGLLDCFGSDDRGVRWVGVFMGELIFSYATAQGVSFGVASLCATEAIGIVWKLAGKTIGLALDEAPALAAWLERNPNLLPRLSLALRRAGQAAFTGQMISAIKKGYALGQAQAQEVATQNLKSELSLSAPPSEQDKDFMNDRSQAAIAHLNSQLKSCRTPAACAEVRARLERAEQSMNATPIAP